MFFWLRSHLCVCAHTLHTHTLNIPAWASLLIRGGGRAGRWSTKQRISIRGVCCSLFHWCRPASTLMLIGREEGGAEQNRDTWRLWFPTASLLTRMLSRLHLLRLSAAVANEPVEAHVHAAVHLECAIRSLDRVGEGVNRQGLIANHCSCGVVGIYIYSH